MDERTWQKANNPRRMLQYLAGWASERKRRLLACACCRRIWPLLPDARSRRIVEIVEHFAAGLTTVDEFRQAQHEAALCANEAERKRGNRREESLNAIRAVQAAAAQWHWAVDKVLHFTQMARTKDQQAERAAQSDLIRELFGNPYRPKGIYPEWRPQNNGALVRIAQEINQECRWDDLPILADALEDAGCANADMLAHCRAGGEHVRGCWVVDVVLGVT